MKYGVYLKEHWLLPVLYLILLGTMETFLLVLQDSGPVMIYFAFALTICFITGTYVDYRRWKRYFFDVHQILDGLDQRYLFCEMLEPTGCQEQRNIKEIMHMMGAAMNDRVAFYKRNTSEYKEYIETWVHEIKTPIAAAKMILTNHKDCGNGLYDEIERMERYVEQALFYARSNEVEKDYLIKRVNLEQIVKEAVISRKRELRLKNAGVEMNDMDRVVFSDSKWLIFMVGQILDNSIKYAKKEGLKLSIRSEEKDNSVFLYITDNGQGIAENEVARVFDKGFTGTTGRTNGASTGIGLYLVSAD